MVRTQGKKSAHASLGLSLVKTRRPEWNRTTNAEHAVVEDTTTALKSVTEENSYDEFIATAQLANKEFTAEKVNVKFVALTAGTGGDEQEDRFTEEEKKRVVVPRRPKWTKEMTAEELDDAEREAFLTWRRAMAHLQNKEGITPFERNIEVWRQLWRVVERSDVIVQIVDARNPLLYRCDDLEEYVKEMGKRNILLINKADFLIENQRKYWSEYFNSINLPHAFYSAALAALKLQKADAVEEGEENEENEDSDSENHEEEDQRIQQIEDNQNRHARSAYPILNREELIEFLRSFNDKEKDADLLAVGLVGYPNVGKSSTINSLMAAKKTSVSATPGKTKHFQTLFLEEDILLCDCPGLVMPAFGGSKGEMVLGGILPIDNLTNYHSAAALLIERIPTAILEDRYGISLPPNYTHEDFLTAYAAIRGFMTVRGIPDCSRAARIVLKDYVNGKLCYSLAPPTVLLEEYQPANFIAPVLDLDELVPQLSILRNENRPMGHKTRMEKTLDRQFFAPATTNAHYKGKHLVSSGLTAESSTSGPPEGKAWKKHGNKNKKEKLRRLYRHLDVE